MSRVPFDSMLDARVARSRAAVLRSATDLLVEGGPSAVTIDAIVGRSGVAKSTIYRHWASRDESSSTSWSRARRCCPTLDPDLDVESALRVIGRAVAGFLNDPEWARMLPALMLLKTHEDGIANLEQRLERHQEEILGRLMVRGVDEGLLRPDARRARGHDPARRPADVRQPHRRGAIDDGFVDRTVDRFLATYRA